LYRSNGRVGYEIDVATKPETPAGQFEEVVQLKTNDPKSPVLSLLVTGSIESALVASPAEIRLGMVQPGEKAVKRVLLKGKTPFTIKGVGGMSDEVKVLCSEGARTVHILQIEVTANAGEEKIDQKLTVHTDLKGQSPLTLPIAGIVRP
jgi:hypothetical protein